MNEVPDTRDSLLVRVCDPQDRDAWEQFSAIYRPLVYRLARGRGLQDADAQDLAQKVLMSVADSIPDWNRRDEGSRFQHWLRRVAKNAAINALSRQPKDRAGGGTTATELLRQHVAGEQPSIDREIELEYRRQLFRRAAEIVRSRAEESTWLAFSMTIIDGQSIATTAQQLRVSESVVYAARSRIMRRLQNVIRELEDEQ
ncbi:MAG: RNA polymerase sigma factor [Rubripirellula sp.]